MIDVIKLINYDFAISDLNKENLRNLENQTNHSSENESQRV